MRFNIKKKKNRSFNRDVSYVASIRKRVREHMFYVSPDSLDDKAIMYDHFVKCDIDTRYSALLRIQYRIQTSESNSSSVTEWKTLGHQIFFQYGDKNSLFLKMEKILFKVSKRLFDTLVKYDIQYNQVIGLQFIFSRVYYTDAVVKRKKLSLSLNQHRDLVNVSKLNTSLSFLPSTSDVNHFGVKLEKVLVDGLVKYIILKNNEQINFAERVKNYSEDFKGFTRDVDFYESLDKDYIMITTVKNILPDKNEIDVYYIDGDKRGSVVDEIQDQDSFSRTTGNVTLNVKNNNVISKEIKQQFKPINPKTALKKGDAIYKFGTLDFEMYLNKDNILKVYAAGFYADPEQRDLFGIKTYYIDESLDSDAVVINCLNDMLKETYNNYVFYVHNFAKFDVAFLLRIVISLCEKNPETYQYEPVVRDGKIICLSIWKTFYYKGEDSNKTYKKRYKIKIVDSFNILTNKLSELCEKYKPSVIKGKFPYQFVTEKTIFYSGVKPAKHYFDNISAEEYEKIGIDIDDLMVGEEQIVKNWNTKDETIKYLESDLKSLYEIMKIFMGHIRTYYGVEVKDYYTISSLAMAIYLKKFYKNNIPLINKKSVYSDIKGSYYGGIVEVYIPHGKDLYDYDVNSLYPFAALNPMPGLNCTYVSKIGKNIENCIESLFGFYYCEIQTTDDYLGLIPTKFSEKSIYNPIGFIKGWYFSEELKFAYEEGYIIHILYGYNFDKSYGVFTKYVENFYSIKANATHTVEKNIAKLFLNSLIGRFGMNLDRSITKLVSYEEYQEILQTRKIVGDVKYINDKLLVTYEASISPDISEDHEVDYKETQLNLLKNSNAKDVFAQENLKSVSVAISSAVTAYAIIFMNKVKLNIIRSGGKIYYSDTDSIVTDKPLSSDLVGNEIGKFKLMHNIKEAYFLGNKTYCIEDKDNKTIIKFNNALSESVRKEDFKKAYHGELVKGFKSITKINYGEGYATIKNKLPVLLSTGSYYFCCLYHLFNKFLSRITNTLYI